MFINTLSSLLDGPLPGKHLLAGVLGGVTGGLISGVLATLAWRQPWLALPAAVVLAATVWGCWRSASAMLRAQALQRDRLVQLERRARQLDEAERLADLGSFEYRPASGELHWSEQAFRLWGYAPGAVVPSLDLIQQHLLPEDAARVSAELQAALAGRSTYDTRYRLRRADGQVRHVLARGKVFNDARGQPERMVGAVLDITDRVQAEASLRVFTFVLDAITDTVSAIDTDRKYRLANAAWHQLTGIARKHAADMHFDHVFPLVVNAERRHALAACLNDDQVHVVRSPVPAPLKPGRIMETRYFPFRDPAVPWRGAVMVSRDVTDDEAAQAALANSLDNLRLTLNTIGDAIFATDALSLDDPVLFVNEQLLDLWRIPPERAQPLTARTILEHSSQQYRDPDAEVARISAIVAGNLDSDDRVELKDGRVLLRRCRARPLDPRPLRVWAYRDITAEVRALAGLAEAEARQRRLMAAFPGYIWAIDEDYRLAYLNPLAADVYQPLVPTTGMAAEALLGRTVLARLQPALARALAGETVSLDWHRASRSGRSPDDLLIKVVPGGAVDGRQLCYAFGIDISPLKQAETALLAAKEEAERANRAKTQFLSSMSHELRTPLNAVIGFSQVLELNHDGGLGPRQLQQVGEIRRAGGHLLALINDLLDLARIEAGHTELELVPVAVDPLIDQCLQLVRPLAARRGCPLEAPPAGSGWVRGDTMRLKQVLLNLLSNAIKYNRPGGRVALQWRPDAEHLLIEVHDEGPGLSAEAQGRLFRAFERLHADGSEVEGTGIGLALSRHLVQLMQGEIGVRSQPGQGSCFWVRLQRAQAPGL